MSVETRNTKRKDETMATATKKPLTFDVTCPHCHGEDEPITINLHDLGECRCHGCDETFTVSEAVAMLEASLAKWRKVERWVEAGRAILAE